ncbi:MAG: DUF2795 domain-containing protein [Geobacter sp.]|nr:MAG: DUF2795 domain-containing protein [Geobacter sp.]
MATTRNVGRGGGKSPANVTKHLKGIDFPAKKQDLIKQAQHAKADQDVMNELQNIEDREYGSMADVMKGFGKQHQAAPKGKAASQPQKRT